MSKLAGQSVNGVYQFEGLITVIEFFKIAHSEVVCAVLKQFQKVAYKLSFKSVHLAICEIIDLHGRPVLTNGNTGVFILQNSTNCRKMDLKKIAC